MTKTVVGLRIEMEDRGRWEAAAKKAGLPLTEFVRLAVEEKLNPLIRLANSPDVKAIRRSGGVTGQ